VQRRRRPHNTNCTISSHGEPSLYLDLRFFTRERDRTVVVTFRNFHVRDITLTLNSLCFHFAGYTLNNERRKQHRTGQQVESREWWLWGFAITVTLVLTAGIVSLTFPGNHLLHSFEWLNLKEWVRGLACLVLLFDIYTVYQQLQLQRIRRELSQRNQLFEVITENAADMIAVVDCAGNRLYNSPSYQKVLGYSPEESRLTSSLEQVHPEDQACVVEMADRARIRGRGERVEYRIRHKDGTWRILEFVQGDSADAVFYIRKGKVRLSVVSKMGKEATIGVLSEGDFFGEGCLAGQPLRMCSATAMTDCTVMRIDKKSPPSRLR